MARGLLLILILAIVIGIVLTVVAARSLKKSALCRDRFPGKPMRLIFEIPIRAPLRLLLPQQRRAPQHQRSDSRQHQQRGEEQQATGESTGGLAHIAHHRRTDESTQRTEGVDQRDAGGQRAAGKKPRRQRPERTARAQITHGRNGQRRHRRHR